MWRNRDGLGRRSVTCSVGPGAPSRSPSRSPVPWSPMTSFPWWWPARVSWSACSTSSSPPPPPPSRGRTPPAHPHHHRLRGGRQALYRPRQRYERLRKEPGTHGPRARRHRHLSGWNPMLDASPCSSHSRWRWESAMPPRWRSRVSMRVSTLDGERVRMTSE